MVITYLDNGLAKKLLGNFTFIIKLQNLIIIQFIRVQFHHHDISRFPAYENLTDSDPYMAANHSPLK